MLKACFSSILCLTLIFSGGCGSGGDEPLEIAGSYTDDWEFAHQITDDSWTMMGSVFHITQYSNDNDYLITQNDSDNEYSPDLWSRFDWTYEGNGDLFYCQIVFDAQSEPAALTSTGADRSDLDTGCGGFGWSRLN